MSGQGPEAVLYDIDGDPMAVENGTVIPALTSLFVSGGSDGTNARFIKVDSSGNQIMIGLGTAGTPAGGVISIQGVVGGTAVPISGTVTANAGSGNFAVVQATAALLNATVIGTVTANIGTSGALALDTTLAKLTITPGTAVGSNTLTMIGGHVTTGSPTYTNGNINPLSLTTAGALRIDGSAVTQPVSGTVTAHQGTAAVLSGKWPVQITDGTNTMPTGDTVSRAIFEKITDGTNTATVKAASTAAVAGDPALVVSVSPNTPAKIWDGTNTATVKAASTAATGAETALVVSVSPNTPVVISTVSPTASTGLVFGQANTGGSANTLAALRATTYTEQTTNAQRSVKSTSANDTSAGTGARQIKITYYDQTMAGPFTETITMNGTAAVNTVSTTICFIEKMVVTSVGSTKSNQGTITLFTTTAGGGTAIGTIAVGSVISAGTVGDNQTLWSHHYVATGKTASISTISSGTTGNQSGVTFLRFIDPTSATAVDTQITEAIATVAAAGSGSVFRAAGIPLKVTGPARITQYAVSNGTNTVFYGGFEYSEL